MPRNWAKARAVTRTITFINCGATISATVQLVLKQALRIGQAPKGRPPRTLWPPGPGNVSGNEAVAATRRFPGRVKLCPSGGRGHVDRSQIVGVAIHDSGCGVDRHQELLAVGRVAIVGNAREMVGPVDFDPDVFHHLHHAIRLALHHQISGARVERLQQCRGLARPVGRDGGLKGQRSQRRTGLGHRCSPVWASRSLAGAWLRQRAAVSTG